VSHTPLVSFVVPCYNYGRYLPDCLASIFGQEDESNFEVIAIDDASTDDTARVFTSLSDPRLQVIRHAKNRGHVWTVNEGLGLARGKFVARIDPDDRYRPSFLRTVLPKFKQFPEVGLVYGDAALIDDEGRLTAERSDLVHGHADFKGNELVGLLEQNRVCAPTAIARREMWHQALPIPEGLAFNDWYFNVMMARRCEFYYVDRVLADYRVHASNHHMRVVRDRTEESSILSLLDRVFSEVESSKDLEDSKRKAKSRVYARQYLTLADKYFGMDMYSDARRCYWASLKTRPSYLLDAVVQRRLAATIIGRGSYELSKRVVKGILVPSSR
jgi:glycosyltransferase involved in cell wall biosynthesis